MDETEVRPARWQHDLYDLLRRNNITQFAMYRIPAIGF
jgi:hypothetical protein